MNSHWYSSNRVVQCGRVNDAQDVFDSSINKTVVHYGAMMKGNLIRSIHCIYKEVSFFFRFLTK